jgi:hypothetical protein
VETYPTADSEALRFLKSFDKETDQYFLIPVSEADEKVLDDEYRAGFDSPPPPSIPQHPYVR